MPAWKIDKMSPLLAQILDEFVEHGACDMELAIRVNKSVSTVKSYMGGARYLSGAATRTGVALWWIREGRYEWLARQEEVAG